MAKIKAALEAVARALKIQHALRFKAVRRMRARHHEQAKAERQAERIGKEADAARAAGDQAKAERKDRKALRLAAKAEKAKHEAIVWKQRALRKAQQIHRLDVRRETLEKRLAEMKPHVGKDGKVAGAKSLGEGFIFVNRYIAAKCASGSRPNFYSMVDAGFNVAHALLKRAQKHIGQLLGERSDCSLYGTECCLAARLPDPNGTHWKSGWTMTALEQHNGWHIVSEDVMRKRGWGIVIYLRWPGDREGHHWANYIGEGGIETMAHGAPPVAPSVIDAFGDGLFVCLVLN